MRPVVVADCFGWFHPARGAATGRGVVLCNAFGYEEACTHRSLGALAERLSAAGLAVLRFDYPGTGDSAGGDAPGRIDDWVGAILGMATWLRGQTGVTEVALCGLRLGAMLAARAAATRHVPIAALALLAPVVIGRGHARELTLFANGAAPVPADPDWIEVNGHRLHQSDMATLRGTDLRRVLDDGTARRMLILEAPLQPGFDAATLERWRAQGSDITVAPFTGYDGFTRDPHWAVAPEEDFSRIVAWLREGAPPPGSDAGAPPAGDTLTLPDGATERLIRFGPRDGLVGILCRPAEETGLPRTAALILNTGADHRIGAGRLGVDLARHLAGLGLASLRIDAAGIGDSAAPEPPPDRPPLYALDAIADVRAALDRLAAEGLGRAIVIGNCSGAYLALHAALRDERLAGAVLGNPQLFYWPDGQSIGLVLKEVAIFGRRPDRPALADPIDRLVSPILHGTRGLRERLRLRHFHLMRDEAARQRLKWRIWRLRLKLLGALTAGGARLRRLGLDPGIGPVWRQFRILARRAAPVLLIYSARDPGLDELAAHFGPAGRRLPETPNVRMRVLEGTDHTIAVAGMRRDFIDAVSEDLCARHGLRPPATEMIEAAPIRTGTTG